MIPDQDLSFGISSLGILAFLNSNHTWNCNLQEFWWSPLCVEPSNWRALSHTLCLFERRHFITPTCKSCDLQYQCCALGYIGKVDSNFLRDTKNDQWKLLEKWQVYFFLSNGNVSRNFVGLKTTHEFLAMNGKLAWVFFSSSICGNFVKVHSPSELEKWSVKIICFSLKITTKKNPGKSSKNQEDFKWLRLGHLPQRVPFGTWWKEFPRRQRNFESLQISREFYEF